MDDVGVFEDEDRERDVLRPLIAGQEVAFGTEKRRPSVLEVRDEEPSVWAEPENNDGFFQGGLPFGLGVG
jgi:hypothetical protein